MKAVLLGIAVLIGISSGAPQQRKTHIPKPPKAPLVHVERKAPKVFGYPQGELPELITKKGCFTPKRLHLVRRIIRGRIVRLQPKAMRSLLEVVEQAKKRGVPVIINYSWRSCALQAKLYNSGIRPCAPPGHSYHNIGLAIDVHVGRGFQVLRHLLLAAGWKQFDPVNDPCHFSYRVTG